MRKPKRPCSHVGCRRIVQDTYCDEHRKQRHQDYDRRRGSSAERGYGHRWRKYRAWFIREHPLCITCREQGVREPANVVDHITPVTGADDPLFWDTDNHQPMCDRCHNTKRATEDKETWKDRRNVTRVTLVCGPPGSGKTTYVEQRKQWGDIVVDVDWLWMALTGEPYYHKPDGLLPYVLAARDAVINKLSQSGEVRRAWVITGAPTLRERQDLARKLRAEIVVLEVSEAECIQRIRNDDRRGHNADAWREYVKRWWREYEPNEGDRVVKG